MGMLDKLKFWKKDEFSSLGLGDDDFGMKDTGEDNMFGEEPRPSMQGDLNRMNERPAQMPPMEPEEPKFEMPKYEEVQRPVRQEMPMYAQNKDMEIISAKLDYIRASLESINTRLANLERIARGEYERRW